MISTKGDYTGNAVLLYDNEGNFIKKCEVSFFDKRLYHIRLRSGLPPSMDVGDVCSLLILTETSPMEYKGRVLIEKLDRVLLLFRGKEKESRRITRYKVNFTALIMSLIREGETYRVHTPIHIHLLDISRIGLRLSAPSNTLRISDRVHIKLKLEESDRILTAVVMNCLDKNETISEYGCSLIEGSVKKKYTDDGAGTKT
jgi:hypothetical protein